MLIYKDPNLEPFFKKKKFIIPLVPAHFTYIASGDTVTQGRGLPVDYTIVIYIEYWNFYKKFNFGKDVLYSKIINH